MARGRHLGEIDGKWPNRLRELRERHSLSQQQVAAALGISYVQVGRIERGKSKLKPEYIEKLLPLIPVQPWDFLMDSPDKRTQMALALSRKLSADDHATWVAQGHVFVERRQGLAEEPAPFRREATRKKRP